MERTAKAIREALNPAKQGRVYIRMMFDVAPIRVFDARERNGELQVKCGVDGPWLTVLMGDELWESN